MKWNSSNALDAHRLSSLPGARISLLCLLLVIFVFYAATLRPGQSWGDDFAMYIHHAKNLAEGYPYSDTGYLYNPAVPVYGPRTYPPVFPIFLAPLYKLSGLNLTPMKWEQVVFFILTLTTLCALWLRDLHTPYTLALIAILGFNPVFWSAKDSVLSDLPFLLFFYGAAILVQSIVRHELGIWPWSFLLGLTLYLVVGTRAAGIALFVGLPLYDWIHRRTIRKLTAIALATCVTLILLQHHFLGALPGSYLEQIRLISWHSIGVNLATYSRVLAGFWVASTRSTFSFLLLALISLLTASGIYFRRTRELTPVEAFLLPYLAVILLWPFAAGIRIVFPFIPWIVFLALKGLGELTTRYSPRFVSWAPCLLLLLLSIPYAQAYRNIGFGPINQGEYLPEFNQLADAICQLTQPNDVLISFRARALSLYTGRPGSTYNYQGSDKEFSDYATKIHARYLVTGSAFGDDHGFLTHYVEQNSTGLELMYRNPKFSLYRIRATSQPLEAHSSSVPLPRVVN